MPEHLYSSPGHDETGPRDAQQGRAGSRAKASRTARRAWSASRDGQRSPLVPIPLRPKEVWSLDSPRTHEAGQAAAVRPGRGEEQAGKDATAAKRAQAASRQVGQCTTINVDFPWNLSRAAFSKHGQPPRTTHRCSKPEVQNSRPKVAAPMHETAWTLAHSGSGPMPDTDGPRMWLPRLRLSVLATSHSELHLHDGRSLLSGER